MKYAYSTSLSKALAEELTTKLDGILSDYDLTEGTFGSEEELTALRDKVEAHSRTSCRLPITFNSWELGTLAEELDNSADSLADNGYKSQAYKMRSKAKDMRALLDTTTQA